MDRMACIDLPFFPIQVLLRRYPDWHNLPVAVVDYDKPQGTILWLNEHAKALRVRPGMRYAAGLSLARDLRAAAVPSPEIDKAVAMVEDWLVFLKGLIDLLDVRGGSFRIGGRRSGVRPRVAGLRNTRGRG